LLLLALAAAMAFFGWPMLALLPAVAHVQLGEGERGYGWMLSAVGAGALLGALVVASFGTPARRRALLGAGVALAAASLAGLACAGSLGVAVLCCAASGCGLILFFATGQATLQLGADEHNRGRVMGIWLMVLSGAQPAGNLVAGLAADRDGVAPVLLQQSAGIALAAALVSLAGLGGWLLRRKRGEG
jgi:MFS family permease